MRGGVARERDPRGDQKEPGGQDCDRDACGQAALDVQAECDCKQRDEDEQVPLLEALGIGVRDLGGLEQECAGEEHGRGREPDLDPRPGASERVRDPDDGSGHDHPARRVREQHRVARDPLQDRPGPEGVTAVRVDAKHPVPAEHREEHRRREDEEEERQPQAPERHRHAEPVGRGRAQQNGDGHDDVLHAGRDRQCGQRDEGELRPACRLCDHVHPGAEGTEHQRIRERVREHRADVDAVRHRQRHR